MITTTRKAWAIAFRTQKPGGGADFAGVYFFGSALPTYMDGNRTALWCTRRAARTAFVARFASPTMRRLYPGAKVVRVAVTITAFDQLAPSLAAYRALEAQ